MMVVVVIIGVLAGIAIIAYTRHIKSGRIVEARTFIATIQARQEAYFQQTGQYCDVAGGAYYPAAAPSGGEAIPWNPASGDWVTLGTRPENGVTRFQYMIRASSPTAHTLANFASVLQIADQPTGVSDAGIAATPHPWYYVVARANLDGDGACQDPPNDGDCTLLYATSMRTEIVVMSEGR
jgi:type II secretory pathway pseudopilin PulG